MIPPAVHIPLREFMDRPSVLNDPLISSWREAVEAIEQRQCWIRFHALGNWEKRYLILELKLEVPAP